MKIRMKTLSRTAVILFTIVIASTMRTAAADVVKTANGVVEGAGRQPGTGVRIFRGVAFAQPPAGDLRWREPQPVKNWKGVRRPTSSAPGACSGRCSATWFRSG